MPEEVSATNSGQRLVSNDHAATAGAGHDSLPPGLGPEPTKARAHSTGVPHGAPAAVDALQQAQSALGAMNASLTAAVAPGGLHGAVAALQLVVMELQRHVLAESAASDSAQCNVDGRATDLLAATARLELEGCDSSEARGLRPHGSKSSLRAERALPN